MEQNTEKFPGLTETEAKKRLETNGLNELPADRQKGFFKILISTLKEPMFLLLIISLIIYFMIGEITEGLALTVSVLFIIGISFYQNQKTEKTLAALKELSNPQITVIRDGISKKIASKELVIGDVVVLTEGERVPADCGILSLTNLSVNESVLTGESLTVSKTLWDQKSTITRPGGNNLPFLYSGTLITEGYCMAEVLATGLKSEMEKLVRLYLKLAEVNQGYKMRLESLFLN